MFLLFLSPSSNGNSSSWSSLGLEGEVYEEHLSFSPSDRLVYGKRHSIAGVGCSNYCVMSCNFLSASAENVSDITNWKQTFALFLRSEDGISQLDLCVCVGRVVGVGKYQGGGSLTSYVCFDVFSNEWTICPYCMLPVWVKKDVPVSKSHTSSGPQHESCALEYIMTHSIQKQLRSLHNTTHQTQNNYIFKHYYCIFLLAVSLFRFLQTQRVI